MKYLLSILIPIFMISLIVTESIQAEETEKSSESTDDYSGVFGPYKEVLLVNVIDARIASSCDEQIDANENLIVINKKDCVQLIKDLNKEYANSDPNRIQSIVKNYEKKYNF